MVDYSLYNSLLRVYLFAAMHFFVRVLTSLPQQAKEREKDYVRRVGQF